MQIKRLKSTIFINILIILGFVAAISSCGTQEAQNSAAKQSNKSLLKDLTTASIADMKTNSPVSITLLSGLSEGATWEITDGRLPTGSISPYPSNVNCDAGTGAVTLCLEKNGGTIYGTPNTAGDYTFRIKAKTIFSNDSASRIYTVAVRDPVQIVNSPELKSWRLNQAGYLETFTATGGRGQYAWSTKEWAKDNVNQTYSSLSPVPGLTLNATTGVLSGTPTASGSFSFVVEAADTANTQERAFLLVSLYVTSGNLTITTETLPTAKLDSVWAPYTLRADGGRAPYTWSFGDGGGAPPYATLSWGGAISGSTVIYDESGVALGWGFSSELTAPGEYNFSLVVTDAEGKSVSKNFQWIIEPAPSTGSVTSTGGISFKDATHDPLAYLDYASVYIRDSLKKTITITNTTAASIDIRSITTTNPAFFVLPVPFILENGASANIDIVFSPTSNIEYAEALELKDSKSNKYSLALSGRGAKVGVKLVNPAAGKVTYFDALATSSLPTMNRPENLIPYAAANFQITGVGALPVKVSVTFDKMPEAPIFYKLIDNTWLKFIPESISGNTIIFSVIDNGSFDSDKTLGTILDPIVVGIDGSTGFGENVSPPSSGSGGGGCFIATAAYGSYLDPHVMVLRHFRDEVLLKSAAGTAFVKLYYVYSPPIADFIREREWLRTLVRLLLTPLIVVVKFPLLLPVSFFGLIAVAWRMANKIFAKKLFLINKS